MAIMAFLTRPGYAGPPAPEKIRIMYVTLQNPPFTLGKGTLIDWTRPGTTIELLKIAERNLNLKFEFKRVPWKRALMMTEANETDAIFHSSFKEERLKIGVYPMKNGKPDQERRLINNSYVLYKLKDSPLEWDGSKFTNLNGPVGAAIGYAIVGDLKKKGVTVEESKKTLNSMLKLVQRRLAAVAELENMADLTLADNPEKFKNIVKVHPPLRTKPYYLMFSHGFVKKYPQVAERIWDEIRKVRESDEFRDIFLRYTR